MEEFYLKCRKCRILLCSSKCLVTPKGQHYKSDPGAEDCHDTLWFLDPDNLLEWITSTIQEAHFIKGKLSCPKCNGRIGAFDFVSPSTCTCTEHQAGSVWITKSRVDLSNNTTQPSPIKHRHSPVQSKSLPELPCDIILLGDDAYSVQDSVFREAGENSANASPIANSHCDASSPTLSAISVEAESETENREHPQSSQTTINDGNAEIGCDTQAFVSTNVESLMSSSLEKEDDQDSLPGKRKNRFEALLDAHSETEQKDGKSEPLEEEAESQEKESDLAELDVDAYTCSICLDIFYLAHSCHPCRHVFCAPCLRRLRGSASDFLTRCPLCRKIIAMCLPHHKMNDAVKAIFPSEYKTRRSMEKKVRAKLPPLPSNKGLMPFFANRNRSHRQGNVVLAHWAGVCFVVLLMVMGMAILGTVIALTLWYAWELCVDLAIDVVISLNDFFDQAWQAIAVTLFEWNVTPETAKLLVGSVGQVMHAFSKLFNQSTVSGAALSIDEEDSSQQQPQQQPFISEALQADLANYTLIGCLITYLVYRFARYRQGYQEEQRANE